MTRDRCTAIIADTLTESYGKELSEYDTDLIMAKDVIRKLCDFVSFEPETKADKLWFLSWKYDRRPNGN